MESNRRISRRTILRSLLAVLPLVAGTRAFGAKQLRLLHIQAPQRENVNGERLTSQQSLEAGAAVSPRVVPAAFEREPSNFRSIYLDEHLRDRFYLFLQNVYHLYPENQFHQLILDLTTEYSTDQEIYQKLLERLPEIKPLFAAARYGLPALRKQKEEMAQQTARLLAQVRSVKGYVEIGTTGRYLNGLKSQINIDGPVYIVNDQTPTYSLEDIFERGQLTQVGSYVPMGNYDPFDGEQIPPESVELVTNFIGFHHSPVDKLERFTQSVWQVLKPGGRLVVRDHDVSGPAMDALVGLAHDVFNAGLNIPWEQNHAQIRHFRSVPQLTQYLGARGFERVGTSLLQDHDPTDNTLMVFAKPSARTV